MRNAVSEFDYRALARIVHESDWAMYKTSGLQL